MKRFFHPTDLAPASEIAFAHALKLTLAYKAELTVFHMARPDTADVDWRSFPRVRQTLAQWDVLLADSPPEAVTKLGIDVHKIEVVGDDPREEIAKQLGESRFDMIVLGTDQHDGPARWLTHEVALPVATNARLMTLFVPPAVDGFVDFDSGRVHLDRVLVPIDGRPSPTLAVDAVSGLAPVAGGTPVTVELLHVGDQRSQPHVHLPKDDGWTWRTTLAEGSPSAEILRHAESVQPNLIVMATSGRHGFLDALHGSASEQIVRKARTPVLTVPAA